MKTRSTCAAPLAGALLGIGLLLAAGQVGAAEYWLCAKRGTVTLPGSPGVMVPIWGYAPDSAGFAGNCTAQPTLPGPALSVPAADATGLTVHLRNQLVAEPTSIVIPGQTAVMTPVKFSDAQGRQRVRSFTHEATAGVDATYTWASLRPGTYLYHSGTHPQVQVQMGLYGALTKNFADAVAAVPPAPALPAMAYAGVPYDAAATLLFSEIDPVQHRAIDGGDYGLATTPTACRDTDGSALPMTSTLCYKPKYFLINGKPFQAGDPPLATLPQGQATLLRFLNAGYRAYVPLIQGTHMKMIAEDGNRYQYRDLSGAAPVTLPRDQYQYSTWLAALKTTDVIVTPAAAGNLPIYDRRLNTVNAGAQDGGMFGVLAVAPPPQADLAITKTDGATSRLAGPMTYTIVVSNAGPNAVTGATVTDTMPAVLNGGVGWTCAPSASCAATTGSGNIATTVNLAVGGTATFTVNATLPSTASGTLTNTATVAPPAGVIDPTPANNSATDTTTILQQADLAVTKTDGRTSVVRGTTGVAYTIFVTNNGPSAVTGATLTDTLPAGAGSRFTVTSWNCTATTGTGSSCTATGTGTTTRNGTVTLPNGGTATFTLVGDVPLTAPLGNSTNSVTIVTPAGVTNLVTSNNTASDTDTILPPPADLAITQNSDARTSVARGSTGVTYTIVATNNGPNAVTGATLTDSLPSTTGGTRFTVNSWSCTASAGSSCTATNTAGGNTRNGAVSLLSGGFASYTLVGTIPLNAPLGSSTNSVTIAWGNDPNATNNTLADTDTIVTAAVAFTGESGVAALNGAGTTLSFGNQIGPVSDTVTLTIGGTGAVTFGTATVTNGGGNTNFSKGATDTCSNTTRAVGATCQIQINFNAPTTTSSRTGTLNVPYTGPLGSPSPRQLNLTGS